MTRLVDLPGTGSPVGRCVILPGRQYSPDGPLLFFAAQVALARGWSVRQVWWDARERPILTDPRVAEPLLTYPAAQFVVIGSDDPYLDEDILNRLPGERLVVPGDHVLRVAGDPSRMIASHGTFLQSFDAWLATLG